MPTYEYECTSCGHRFTQFQGMNDQPLDTCPKCSGSVRRLISGGSGVFVKGSNLYDGNLKRGEGSSDSCCGQINPCSDPKRCCGK